MLLKQNDVFKSSNPALSASKLWVVTGTAFTGGGEGHGPGDSYPDGHNVDAGAVTSEGVPTGSVVSFYQTGCFNNMILPKDVDIVGVAIPQHRYHLNLK